VIQPAVTATRKMPIRILHVIRSIDPKEGGPMEGLRRLSEVISRTEHPSEVICMDDSTESYVRGNPFITHAIGRGLGKYSFHVKLAPWLRNNVHRFDAVIVNGLWQYQGIATWRALRHSPLPYFVFPHGMLDPWFKHAYPLKHAKKLAYWLLAESRVLRDARAVLYTCEEERLLAAKTFPGYHCREIVSGYGTARPPSDKARLIEVFLSEFPRLHGRRLVLFLSRLHEKKGCDLLLHAFADIAAADPRLHLVIAGTGAPTMIDELKAIAARRGIAERVYWTGMLQGDRKWGALYASELFCLPSHQENFGIAVAEALGCGLPVAISNKVNIWREIERAGAGFVGDDTREATRRNLLIWLERTQGQSGAKLADAARKCFETYFNVDRFAARIIEIVVEARQQRLASAAPSLPR